MEIDGFGQFAKTMDNTCDFFWSFQSFMTNLQNNIQYCGLNGAYPRYYRHVNVQRVRAGHIYEDPHRLAN